MPPRLDALKDSYVTDEKQLLCPAGRPGELYTPPFSLPAESYRYGYRFLIKPSLTTIICWDSVPHLTRHGLFPFLNRQYRNVLLVNGTVKTLSEDEFEALHLPENYHLR